jgi:transcription antitermination factor NusG
MANEHSSIFPACLFEVAETELPGAESRRWWVVYTKSRQEKVFSKQLAVRAVPHYLPLIEKRRVNSARERVSDVPLFPGYVFMFCSEKERAYSLTTNRVSKILDVGDPGQLRAELEQVHRLIVSGAPLTAEQRLSRGQMVRIRCGAMAGMEGEITQRHGKRCLVIWVSFIGMGVSIEIDDSDVEAVK